MNAQPPKGQFYHHLYIDRGTPTADCPRMRRRLGHLIDHGFSSCLGDGFGMYADSKLGVPTHWEYVGETWIAFLEKCELRDVLAIVTHVYKYLIPVDNGSHAKAWLRAVSAILDEENIGYAVDDQSGVHPKIDGEYEHNCAASLAGLEAPRYRNVREQFEAARSHLGKVKPDGKLGIRSVFAAAEGLFRLMCPTAPRLTGKEAVRFLEPMLQSVYEGDRAAQATARKMLSSFESWADAAQFYRHEPGTEEPAQPPLEISVNLISAGASHIRWLATLDATAVAIERGTPAE